MYVTNLIIVHGVRDKAALQTALHEFGELVHCNINFDITNVLLELPFIRVADHDVAFEIIDKHEKNGEGLFLSLESPFLAASPERIPLTACFTILQEMIRVSLGFSSNAEIFLTNSHADSSDLTVHRISADRIQRFLFEAYGKNPVWSPYIPDLHIYVTNATAQ